MRRFWYHTRHIPKKLNISPECVQCGCILNYGDCGHSSPKQNVNEFEKKIKSQYNIGSNCCPSIKGVENIQKSVSSVRFFFINFVSSAMLLRKILKNSYTFEKITHSFNFFYKKVQLPKTAQRIFEIFFLFELKRKNIEKQLS